MPKREDARAAWNFLSVDEPWSEQKYSALSLGQSQFTEYSRLGKSLGSTAANQRISVTFNMNLLQTIPTPNQPRSPGNVFVTMNPVHPPDPSTVQASATYAHPKYTPTTLQAQQDLQAINGICGVSFAGAWMRYGFHEDGFTSGMSAANALLGAGSDEIPCINFAERNIRRTIGSCPHHRDLVWRMIIAGIQSLIMFAATFRTFADEAAVPI